MNCDAFDEDRVRVAFGEPPSPAYREHAETCDSCREEESENRKVLRRYRDAATDRLPSAPAARLSSMPGIRPRPAAVRSLVAAAAAVVALGVLWAMLSWSPGSPESDLAWEPAVRVANLGDIDLDQRIEVEMIRVDAVGSTRSDIDVDLDDLKRRLDSALVDTRKM